MVLVSVAVLWESVESKFRLYKTRYHLPLSAGGGGLSVQILKRGNQKKNESLGGLKEFLPWTFAWGGLTMFLVKKQTFKNKICL